MNDPIASLVIRLYTLGRSPEHISKRVNKPLGWVREVLAHIPADVVVEAQEDQPVVDDGTEIWSEEWTQFAVERLTPVAFRTLEQVMRDPDASHAARVKAAELLLKFQPKLKENKEVDEEKITRLTLDDQTLRILQQISQEDRF